MKGKEILCPYCCNRFMPSKVHYRLKRAEVYDTEKKEQSKPNIGKKQSDDTLNMMAPVPNSLKNQISQDNTIHAASLGSKLVLDQQLYEYYIGKLGMSDADARSNAMNYGYVEFDLGNPDIDYNVYEFDNHGYVNEIYFKGQHLNKRLCPYCHKKVIDNSGKYDMVMISVIGDTNVGKTVYITVLQQMIKNDSFNGSLCFMGSSEEWELYFGNIDRLINKKEMNKATDRIKVPPLPFLFTYTTRDTENKKTLVIFCDIAGEDCRNHKSLEQKGFHLAKSSGLIFMMDPTRFSLIRNSIEKADNTLENMYQVEVVTAINRYLLTNNYNDKIEIPTAIELTKSDTLKEIAYYNQDERRRNLLNNHGMSCLHPGYITLDEVKEMDEVVQNFLIEINEKDLYNSKRLFKNYNFFLCSSLGKAPVLQMKIEDGNEVYEKVLQGSFNPVRVSEAFYWILMMNGLIPIRYVEEWRDKKGRGVTIEEFYYHGKEDELYERLFYLSESNGVKNSIINRWTLIKKSGLIE
ncbi:MAG: TRAFAC clade GTPase domain-containing protein [Mobilitalea sp.]